MCRTELEFLESVLCSVNVLFSISSRGRFYWMICLLLHYNKAHLDQNVCLADLKIIRITFGYFSADGGTRLCQRCCRFNPHDQAGSNPMSTKICVDPKA